MGPANQGVPNPCVDKVPIGEKAENPSKQVGETDEYEVGESESAICRKFHIEAQRDSVRQRYDEQDYPRDFRQRPF